MAGDAPPSPVDPAPGGPWRIDELARRAGLTVDTVRFYRREGLLPPDRARGRSRLYGPEHLRRLAQVRLLRRRRVGVAAIRELAAGGLLDLLSPPPPVAGPFDAEALAAASGLRRDVVDRLVRAGVLGRGAFDDDDLRVAAAAGRLERALGPDGVVRVAAFCARLADAAAPRLAALVGPAGAGPEVELGPLLEALLRRAVARAGATATRTA